MVHPNAMHSDNAFVVWNDRGIVCAFCAMIFEIIIKVINGACSSEPVLIYSGGQLRCTS